MNRRGPLAQVTCQQVATVGWLKLWRLTRDLRACGDRQALAWKTAAVPGGSASARSRNVAMRLVDDPCFPLTTLLRIRALRAVDEELSARWASFGAAMDFVGEARFVSVQGRPEALSRDASAERVANVLAAAARLSPALATWHDVESHQTVYPQASPRNVKLTPSDSGFEWWGWDGAEATLHIHVGALNAVFGNYVTLRPVPVGNWDLDIADVLSDLAAPFEAESGMFGSATLGHELGDSSTDAGIWPSWAVFVCGSDAPGAGKGYSVRRATTGWILSTADYDFEPATLEAVEELTAEARRYVTRERAQRG